MTSTERSNPPAPGAGDHHSTPEAPTPNKDSKLDLSMTQILGGALAAMTAAALGSRLGVAGTITGAAVASVVAGVAGSLYTASLRHTREKVATALTSLRDADASPANRHHPSPRPTAVPVAGHRRKRRGVPWKGVLAATVATFAVALVALTGLESLAGAALSGGHGTTVEQVTKSKGKHSSDSDTKGSDSKSSDDSSSDTKSSKPNSPTESSKPTADPSTSDTAPSDKPTSADTAPAKPTSEPTGPATKPTRASCCRSGWQRRAGRRPDQRLA